MEEVAVEQVEVDVEVEVEVEVRGSRSKVRGRDEEPTAHRANTKHKNNKKNIKEFKLQSDVASSIFGAGCSIGSWVERFDP